MHCDKHGTADFCPDCLVEPLEGRIAELEGWIEDCLQMLTGDDDVCAALSKMEAAAKPQFEALLAGGDELLSEAEQKGRE